MAALHLFKNLSPETPRVRKLIFFSGIVMLCLCFYVTYQAYVSYQTSIEEGKRDAARLNRILADHVELTFLSVDLSLRRAVERQYFNNLFGGSLPDYMEHNFAMWVKELPQISAMMLINAEGYPEATAYEQGFDNFVVSSTVEGEMMLEGGKDQNVLDSYFYMTSGFKKGEPNSRVIIMSRKLNKLDGSYGGVVLAVIDPAYFIEFFDSISHGKSHFMNVTLSNGTSMVSGPGKGGQYDDLRDYLRKEAIKLKGSGEILTKAEMVNSAQKIISHSNLGSFPVVVSIALDSNDFLAFWRSNQLNDVLYLVIFLLFGSTLSLFAITMEKQMKRVQESEASAVLASQTKSEFLANMSHEFRTPLNAIIGFSEMLMSNYFGPLNPKQTERIHDINLCGTHLLQLISDILEFSKGEAGKLELKEEVVDLREITEECRRMLREKISLKQVTLKVRLDSAHPWLLGDKRKIRQILLNLLSNAVKFTPQNGTITIRSIFKEGGKLILAVADTGIGMAEEDIPKALSVFGQVHRRQSLEGTGLGLPLCKIFAELHGGTLDIQSILGEGTTVKITFPESRVLSEAQAEMEPAARSTLGENASATDKALGAFDGKHEEDI